MGGPLAACLVVAVSAAIAMIATGSIAFRLAGTPAAIVAAVTLATCPTFIFQSVQPMSDVPVTAAWMVGWALLIGPASGIRQPAPSADVGHDFGRALLAGVACAIAVLIRPNLAPLAAVPFAYLLVVALGTRRRSLGTEQRATARQALGTPGTLGTFVLPIAIAGLFLAWLQWHWYGSSFRSGYGTVEQLYSFSSIGPNASRYATWLLSTSPVLLLALVGLWIRRSAATWALAAFAALNAAAYLVYFAFNEWSYLRFLMPALAIASVFTGVAVAALVDRLDAPARAAVLLAAVLVIAGVGVSRARALDAFRLADAHRRVLQIDRYLDSALPPQAVVIAGEQSGAVRFDTGRAIIRWEAASPDDLARVLAVLEGSGRPVWVVLDVWEEPLVRAKFSGLDAAALDWPPVVDAGDAHRTRAWSISDRGRYLKGARIVTDRLR
jgi:4-amino-4-deoxy-L-arabinose transferase-like glycosyltransferase